MIVPQLSTEFIWFCVGYGACAMASDLWQVVIYGWRWVREIFKK
jgi:hypothetical protein